jgi:hypothetical protein
MTNLMHAFPAQLDTVDGPAKASIILSWVPDQPMILTFDMAAVDTDGTTSRRRWDISRDLVLDAILNPGPHGEGDVITEVSAPFFLLYLMGVDDTGQPLGCQIRMPLGSVAWLAEQSTQIVAPGSATELIAVGEWVDARLDECMRGAA